MTDTRNLAVELIQQKGYGFWKLYEGSKRVAECDAEENPEGSNEVALNLFLQDIQGREGKHEIVVYKKVNGSSGGTRKAFFLVNNRSNSNPMYTQGPALNDLQAIYDQARKDVEAQERMKRIEEKLDLILLYIKNANDDDDKNDNTAINLIGKVLGNAISKPAATVNNIVPRTAPANAGAFSL